MNDDAELLQRFVDARSEDAFAKLVQRHLGLVYGTALRRVGWDTQLAEDVAQEVFADLARKAPGLKGRETLAGWLFAAAHVASAAIVRSERRRKTREIEAHDMQTLLTDSTSGPDWHHLRPVLDEAVLALRDDEREAIALRFFAQRSFAEIGAVLRLTDEAARKRLDRALEKLRRALERRGVTSTTAMLTLALAEFRPQVAPAGLAHKITSHALAQSTATGASFIATVAAGLAIATALVGSGWAVAHQYRVNRELAAELVQLQAGQRALGALRTENLGLAWRAREVDDLRSAAAKAVALRATLQPVLSTTEVPTPVRATVTVQPNGTLQWGNEGVKLADFVARLKALGVNAPNGEAKLDIRGLSEFSALSYVINEARKAQIAHVVVESNTPIDPKLKWRLWFGPQ